MCQNNRRKQIEKRRNIMLELKNISFERDNKKILSDINLKIGSNEFIAITGPNGSRKIYSCKNNNGN
jgi:ABC-type molybdenum transport system ATPase subunit/photorepair protein PhrA